MPGASSPFNVRQSLIPAIIRMCLHNTGVECGEKKQEGQERTVLFEHSAFVDNFNIP